MRLILMFIISCSFLFSCNKNDDGIGRRQWGTISAMKNGEFWEGEIYSLSKSYSFEAGQGVDIFINRYNEKGYHREELYFYKVPDKVDKYPLSQTSFLDKDSLIGADYFTSVDDGDVLGEIYYLILNDSIEDYIEITDVSGKELFGRFQASFAKDTTSLDGDPSAPDTVIFTNGKFHTKVLD